MKNYIAELQENVKRLEHSILMPNTFQKNQIEIMQGQVESYKKRILELQKAKAEKKVKVTIYTKGSFFGSINKTEAYLKDIYKKDYAQYKSAVHVSFVPKGKKNGFVIRGTYDPYILVLEGFGHPDPDGMFGPERTLGSGVVIKQSKYSSFDSRYATDFDQVINSHIESANVLVDLRASAGTNLVKFN